MALTKNDEYLEKGDYHKHLDKTWPFYPVYLAKMKLVKKFLNQHGKDKKILDIGCGEGILVEEMSAQGYDILGADLNYQSELVLKRNILDTGFESNSFDIVLCLDVIEHLNFGEQEKALAEIKRILKPEGILVLTVPNLAHFTSRISFLFLGRLIRTSKIERHKGDRPIQEYLKLLKKNNFSIGERKGLFPTFPILSLMTYYFPDKMVFCHKIYNKFFAYPNWCFLNFLACQNKKN
jgi:2-polyprenyl-3-methyl-5-hydroxy-6-metoxy-1,4-benzoquinol methylase